jgi:outer membrane protein assembly factor BamA
MAPFDLGANSEFVSKTKISARYEYFARNDQYTLNSFLTSYGFLWKNNRYNEFSFNPLSVNYVNPVNITPSYQALLDTNITLRRSIEPQLIVGPTLGFTYNEQAVPNSKWHNFYFSTNLDIAGTLLSIIKGTAFNKTTDAKILGTVYSQFARADMELRHYWRLNPENTTRLVSRLYAGAALPYGNSNRIPFVRAFFIGGTNSLRGFRARSLGPGDYYVRNYNASGYVPDQPGDVKFEINTELRAKLISIINGAAFIDAGNIWTIREDQDRPGSGISTKFYNQIAASAGLGLRFDITFLVLRMDLACPIRKAVLDEGMSWSFDKLYFGSSSWRKENLIFNLAIGYPF